jgi:hypothetical protein
MEDFDDDATAPQPPQDVSGYLEILHEAQQMEMDVPTKWRKNTKLIPLPEGDPIPSLTITYPLLQEKSALEFFQLFFTNDMANLICLETIRYARQNNDFTLTVEEVMNFVTIILWSGYVVLPRLKMYWDTGMDCNFSFASKIMSRDRFISIKRYLHFVNNDITNDKTNRFMKVQPLFDEMNKNLKQFGIFDRNLALDEQMVSYTGRHPMKQFIRNKPIRWGFKNFLLATSDGYPLHILPYGGQSVDKTTPLTVKVVMTMSQVIRENSHLANHVLYMDNFYTSWKTLSLLHNLQLRATGTVRSNRTNRCPLADDSKIANRGEFDYNCDGKVLFIKWNDNTSVIMGTNFDSIYPVHQLTRWSKDGAHKIQSPNCVKAYNSLMGGVDLVNRFIQDYCPSITGTS